MADSPGGYKDDNTVNEDDISTVNKKDHYSPGQSSILLQRLKSLNLPPELRNAAEALEKYYPERKANNDLKEFYDILYEEFDEDPPPPTSPTYKTPWREVSWGNNDSDLKYVKDYQPQNDEVQHLRVLLYGQVGAGKSCFINSVSTVLQRRITIPALTSATTSDQSFTKKYRTHKIPKEGRGNFYPFVFSDIMGLLEGSGRGVRVEDIKLIMKGHVKDGYKFNPGSPLSPGDPYYNPSPSLEDRVHVLVCVQSAIVADIKSSVLQKMKDIREAASDLGIPQIAVVTKIDEACEETEKDLKNIYKSKHLKRKMTKLIAYLGIPINCIFPVKNYSEEFDVKDDVDTLILSALKLMLDLGDDFICSL